MAKQEGTRVGMMTLRWNFGIINMEERVKLWTQEWVFLQLQIPTHPYHTLPSHPLLLQRKQSILKTLFIYFFFLICAFSAILIRSILIWRLLIWFVCWILLLPVSLVRLLTGLLLCYLLSFFLHDFDHQAWIFLFWYLVWLCFNLAGCVLLGLWCYRKSALYYISIFLFGGCQFAFAWE